MADIHVLPVRADNDTGHITTLLENAFADGVDLGPRGHHIKAIALTLQQQVECLRQVADEFRDNPVREVVGLDQLEVQILRLSESLTNLAAMARNVGE
jgi:hypothetical protein